MFGRTLLVLYAVNVVAAADGKYRQSSSKRGKGVVVNVCANVMCGEGRECIVQDGHQPNCECIALCPDIYEPVCGSDRNTYSSLCQLHRAACHLGKSAQVAYPGPCLELTGAGESKSIAKPVACLAKDRDSVRSRLISWLQRVSGSASTAANYLAVLKQFFDSLDANKDGKLESLELNSLLEKNGSVTEDLGSDPRVNPIIRGLCVDALIALSDRNSDMALTQHEFLRCLDPNFQPHQELCELDGKVYADGAEVPSDCNSCVCACGNWICTALNCQYPAAEGAMLMAAKLGEKIDKAAALV